MRGKCCVALALVSGCGSSSTTPNPVVVKPDDSPGLTSAIDENPDPHVFELHLEAKGQVVSYVDGLSTSAWTYNGTVPGPLIDVAVGDELRVHFKNSLSEATTIHWHGLRIPNAMDGAIVVQSPVPSGGTFEYDFEF